MLFYGTIFAVNFFWHSFCYVIFSGTIFACDEKIVPMQISCQRRNEIFEIFNLSYIGLSIVSWSDFKLRSWHDYCYVQHLARSLHETHHTHQTQNLFTLPTYNYLLIVSWTPVRTIHIRTSSY